MSLMRSMSMMYPQYDSDQEEQDQAEYAQAQAQAEERKQLQDKEDADEWTEIERLATLYDEQEGAHNDPEIEEAFYIVKEKLYKEQFKIMEPLYEAKVLATNKLCASEAEFNKDKDLSKITSGKNLLVAIEEYETAVKVFDAAKLKMFGGV